jgi:Na+-translocating ferredoxin:NAD+ oxidoreductase RnfD subunit
VWRKAKKFFQAPKGLVTIILVMLTVIAAPGQGVRVALGGMASAAIASGLVDTLIIRFRKDAWEFPSGAVLTAMIVAMVLRAQEPWYVVTITSVTAVLSKYIFRSRSANLFNPAALAIIASFYVFHTGQSWWGVPANRIYISKGLGVFLLEISPWRDLVLKNRQA